MKIRIEKAQGNLNISCVDDLGNGFIVGQLLIPGSGSGYRDSFSDKRDVILDYLIESLNNKEVNLK